MTRRALIGITRCCPTHGNPATVLDVEVVSIPEEEDFIWWHCSCCQGWHIDVGALNRANGHKSSQSVLVSEPDH